MKTPSQTRCRCRPPLQRWLCQNRWPEKVAYVGVYYRCDDLYFAFPRYTVPGREETIDLPVHFVTSTLLTELLETLERWVREFFRDEFQRTEARVTAKLWDVLGLTMPSQPGAETFKVLAVELQKQRRRAADQQRFANDAKRAI